MPEKKQEKVVSLAEVKKEKAQAEEKRKYDEAMQEFRGRAFKLFKLDPERDRLIGTVIAEKSDPEVD